MDSADADAKLAVAHIGWSGPYSQVNMSEVFSSLKGIYSDYAFMGELSGCEFISQPGEEVYVVIPAKDTYSLKVYAVVWGDDTETGMPERGELLYQGKPGEIVVDDEEY